MLIFNHPLLENEKFHKIDSIDDISKTPSNSIVRFIFSKDNIQIIKFCQKNSVMCAIDVESITDALLASSLDASYLIVSEENAPNIQKVAETYLFDAKIIVTSKDIEKYALLGIDGIIFN